MRKKQTTSLIPVERIERAILLIRGHKVMLDRDLAELYGVKAIALRQQVSRNEARFPPDFMFRLNPEEADALVSQNVIPSKRSLGGSLPYAFTQEGVAMLSSVLRSERAMHVNIEIMRTFVRLREMLASNAELAQRLNELEKKYDAQFRVVFDAIRQLMAPSTPRPQHRIGFHVSAEKQAAPAAREEGSGRRRQAGGGSLGSIGKGGGPQNIKRAPWL
jgi:hypothetical protein